MSPQLERYIEEHISPELPELERIDRATNLRLVNGRMCSGHLQGRLLKMLVEMIRPKKALELGTFSGYSALCIAEGLPSDGSLVTVEADDELADFIAENIASLPWGTKVTPITGDAIEVMEKMPDCEFDLIFIDADKRQYPEYYRLAKRKLRHGGYIIADNTLWDGHVVETSKHAPQTKGVMDFNDIVRADKDVEKVILPLRDGLTIIRLKEKTE